MTLDSQSKVPDITSTIFNSLSFLGCLIAFYMYFRLSLTKSAQFKMLVALTLSDFLIAITGFFMTFTYPDNTSCTVGLLLSTIGYWSSAFWSLCLAIFSYKVLMKMEDFYPDAFYKLSLYCWTIICIVVPLM